MAHESSELFEGVLTLVELTEVAGRMPAGARELWALDCAKRAVNADVPALRTSVRGLEQHLSIARRLWHTPLDEEPNKHLREAVALGQQAARDRLDDLRERNAETGGLERAIAVVSSVLHALSGVVGYPSHESAARAAQKAFEDPFEEADNQARRLLLRAKLIPTGAELLVRLDYAEDHGAMPKSPEQRAWLDAQRELLMNEDEDGRMAVVFRHFSRVFLAELSRAR